MLSSANKYFQPSEISARSWVLAGFFLPVNKTITIIALLVAGLFAWIGPAARNNFQTLKKNFLLWLPALYFFWHLVSILWSENRSECTLDIQSKLSFILIPLVVGSALPGQRHRLNFFIALMVAVLLNALWSLFNAFQAYEVDGFTFHFFNSELSPGIHVVYLTIMVTMCLLFLIYDLFYSRKMDPQPWALITAMLALCLFTVLLDSGTAFVTLVLVCTGYFIITTLSLGRIRQNLFPFILFMMLFAAGYWGLSRINNRSGEVGNMKENFGPETEGQVANAAHAVLLPELWKNTMAVIVQHKMTGVGCGDLNDELQKQYTITGFSPGLEFRLNPHNQYLHTTAGTGIIGLFLLLAMLFIPAWISFRVKNWFVFSFLLVFIVNAVSESVLEDQNGILLFTIIYALVIPELAEKKELVVD